MTSLFTPSPSTEPRSEPDKCQSACPDTTVTDDDIPGPSGLAEETKPSGLSLAFTVVVFVSFVISGAFKL